MPAAEKRAAVAAASSSSSTPEFDPLIKDLTEKKFNFRNNVKGLVTELHDVRSRLASREKSLWDESTARQNLKELDGLGSQLSFNQATAETSTASAQSAQSQYLSMSKELDEKNNSLKDHETKVNKLEEQLDHLQNDLRARELSQKQLKDEVARIEKKIMHRVSIVGENKECEIKKIVDEISSKNIENINERLNSKNEEIARLKDEIKFLSVRWKLKTEELESQLEKQRRADQELKRRVLKLEFCLQEAKDHIRKLQRMGERRDKDMKELRDQVGMKKDSGDGRGEKKYFWESADFKFIVTLSVLVLAVFAKR